MRMIAAVLAAAVLCAAPVRAEHEEGHEGGERGRPEEMSPADHAKKMLEHMDKELKLSDAQKKKLSPMLEKAAAERKELHEKVMKADREHSEKVRAELTDEQKEKYDMMRARRKMMGEGMRKRMNKGEGRRGGKRGERGGEGDRDEHDDHDDKPEGGKKN